MGRVARRFFNARNGSADHLSRCSEIDDLNSLALREISLQAVLIRASDRNSGDNVLPKYPDLWGMTGGDRSVGYLCGRPTMIANSKKGILARIGFGRNGLNPQKLPRADLLRMIA